MTKGKRTKRQGAKATTRTATAVVVTGLEKSLVKKIDVAAKKGNFSTRSKFLRNLLQETL